LIFLYLGLKTSSRCTSWKASCQHFFVLGKIISFIIISIESLAPKLCNPRQPLKHFTVKKRKIFCGESRRTIWAERTNCKCKKDWLRISKNLLEKYKGKDTNKIESHVKNKQGEKEFVPMKQKFANFFLKWNKFGWGRKTVCSNQSQRDIFAAKIFLSKKE